jgi:hypothetical protein
LTATVPRFAGAFAVASRFNAAIVWAAIGVTALSPYVAQIAGVVVYSIAFFVLCRVWVFAGVSSAPGAVAGWRCWDLGGFLPVGLAIMAAFALAILLRTMEAQGTASRPVRLSVALALLSAVLFLVPLHTYDLPLAAPLVLLPALASAPWRLDTLGSLACFLVVVRMNNLARATGMRLPGETSFAGSAIASVALLVLVLVSLLHVRNEARQKGPSAS